MDLRSKTVLTAVGEVKLLRPYSLCSYCHEGQFPMDAELDVKHTKLSPGVRRMLAVVGAEAPFDHGRQQMKALAGLKVTAKSVERTAETIGADIVHREEMEVERAMQLDLPIIIGEQIPVLYVEMAATGIPAVKKETVGRQGKTDGQPAHTPRCQTGLRVHPDQMGSGGVGHSRPPIRPPTPAPLRPPKNLASESIWRLGIVVGIGRQRRSSSGMEPNGSGTLRINTSSARSKLSISITPVNTCGTWLASCTPATL
ncbi:MAG: hypothetical protein JJE04_22770 [Acidobacteriia bacterium]|nr:hypothetical protein [Terriglobia bacterium]